MTTHELEVHVDSQCRLFPEDLHSRPVEVPLSIIDATVAGFAPTSAVWLYDAPLKEQDRLAFSPDNLTKSLKKALNAYPHWAGKLERVPYVPGGNHTQRYGRLSLSYGHLSDPGVEFVIARCPQLLASIAPSAAERAGTPNSWNAGAFPIKNLLPYTQLPELDKPDNSNPPCFIIQLTIFACGGLAITTQMSHPLADAQSLVQFMHDWSRINRALLARPTLPVSSPLFDPSLLDARAAGDIDSLTPDPSLISLARSLPLNRNDWWTPAPQSAPTHPDGITPPPGLDPALIAPRGMPLPWPHQWDFSAPCGCLILHFTADEVQRLWEAASLSSDITITRMDAILAHVWTLINRARGVTSTPENPVYMNLTFNLRPRVSPPLPTTFIGSPIQLAAVTLPSPSLSQTTARDPTITAMAQAIHSTLSLFTQSPNALPALLHSQAHEPHPTRFWQGLLGSHNLIITPWTQIGLHEVDFIGTGQKPRYAGGVMPDGCDGVVVVAEAGVQESAAETSESESEGDIDGGSTSTKERGRGSRRGRHWTANGVDVSLYLAQKTLDRLADDKEVHRYRKT
ncbi:MAG: hypothetical protein M1819_000424 [Sarea resinae]|nr:MAG: hypothetical protein M1819_000424 [Sarea resinae]